MAELQPEFEVKNDTGVPAPVKISDGVLDATIVAATPSLSAPALAIRPIPYAPQSYSAAAVGFVPPASATDVFTITGSATKTIRINKIRVTGTTTSGSAIKTVFNLIKRSTAATGGTRVAATAVPHDSTNAAATATVGHYTANPTVGTPVGTIRSIAGSVSATGISGGDIVFEFEINQPIILRGITEQLAVNLNGVTITGPIMSISVDWSEV